MAWSLIVSQRRHGKYWTSTWPQRTIFEHARKTKSFQLCKWWHKLSVDMAPIIYWLSEYYWPIKVFSTYLYVIDLMIEIDMLYLSYMIMYDSLFCKLMTLLWSVLYYEVLRWQLHTDHSLNLERILLIELWIILNQWIKVAKLTTISMLPMAQNRSLSYLQYNCGMPSGINYLKWSICYPSSSRKKAGLIVQLISQKYLNRLLRLKIWPQIRDGGQKARRYIIFIHTSRV